MADFDGRWRVVSSPAFDDEYLRMEVPPYVELYQQGTEVSGTYHIGLQSGSLDGKVRKDGSLRFSFEGSDELDEVHGAGTAHVQERRLTLTLEYHYGEEYTFKCRREAEG